MLTTFGKTLLFSFVAMFGLSFSLSASAAENDAKAIQICQCIAQGKDQNCNRLPTGMPGEAGPGSDTHQTSPASHTRTSQAR